MKQYEAIYVRQSVDRPDSISTESQVEICKKEVSEGAEYKVYTDKGYSGKNTERPAFQELLKDILAGKVSRIIVYRLDRMTRSVLDFANIIILLKEHDVSFASTMEKFDTATPLGNAMLMIVMVFAQLERETIQQRVKDAYLSRSKRGFYMGGAYPRTGRRWRSKLGNPLFVTSFYKMRDALGYPKASIDCYDVIS